MEVVAVAGPEMNKKKNRHRPSYTNYNTYYYSRRGTAQLQVRATDKSKLPMPIMPYRDPGIVVVPDLHAECP